MVELSRIVESVRRTKGAALMGVLNLTPDSFFDGGLYDQPDPARARVDALLAEGADIIDIGGESSRPGAAPVAAEEQIERIADALEYTVAKGALVSVDTTSPVVAEFALVRGAALVNDISCLADGDLAQVVSDHDAALVLTHSRGPMAKMRGFSTWPDADYRNIVAEVIHEWSAARDRALAKGVRRDAVLMDPGLGFSKNARQSLELLSRLEELRALGALIVVGPSRKSFIAAVDSAPPKERLGGTIAACIAAVERGADVLRVHDVQEVRQALGLIGAMRASAREGGRARV